MCEVEVHTCFKRDNLVVCKLSSIVTRETLLVFSRNIRKHILESVTYTPSCLLFGMTREEVSTGTLCCSDDSMGSCLCRYNGIYLPMSDLTSLASYFRCWIIYSSLFDHNSILYLVFLFSCFHLLLVLFSSSSQMADEVRMMRVYVLVDRIFRENLSSFFFPPSCYLVWSISEWIILCSCETEDDIFLQVTSRQDTTVERLIEICS